MPDLSHNPRPMPSKARRAAEWLYECAAKSECPGMRANYRACARLILSQEKTMTRVGKIARAALQKNVDLQHQVESANANVPPADRVIDADDVQALGELATASGVDPTTGEVPVLPPTAPVVQ